MNRTHILSTLGKKIRDIRVEKKITQAELADMCGFEKGSMSRIESGQRNLSTLTLVRISDALDVHMKDFFTD
jgi:transcriptional regulator with XRE-family HTH domain